MPSHANKSFIYFDGKPFNVSVVICGDTIELSIQLSLVEECPSELKLGAPFRNQLEITRINIVIEALLSHDFLLKKNLLDGKELKFQIKYNLTSSFNKRELVVCQLPSMILSANSTEVVLPWLVECPGLEDLYPFQKLGVSWLLEAKNRLLADDMGLGKTIQTIFGVRVGFNRYLFKKVLILCPKSLMLNWLFEFRKWAPELISLALAPSEKNSHEVWAKALGNSHVIISNYEQIRGACLGMKQGKFDLVVADEAHRLRNATSQVSLGFRTLQRDRFWALTGTPIERDIQDLATLMSLIDAKRFSALDANGASAPLREKAKPYILRRTKESVLQDLPGVINVTTHIFLFPEQLKTYRQVQFGRGCTGEKISNGLQKLGELRRVCDFDPVSRSSSKIERIYEDVCLVKQLGEKAIVFSYIREPLDALYEKFSDNVGAVIIDGRMTIGDRQESIERFKCNSGITVLLASSKVASEGLTLVEANHVFFINRWWNPSSNAQARDRVNRIGQKRKVFIHEYVCLGTIEEDIEKLLENKNAIYDEVIGQIALSIQGLPNK